MNFTVANRIRFGFLVITVILIATGIASIAGLSSISRSTEQVKSISIPALTHSAQLQVQFVKMSENALEDFYTYDLGALADVEQRFNQNNQLFISETAKLKAKISQNPLLSSALKTVLGSSESFVANVAELFTAHSNQLTLEASIKTQLESLEEAVDDATSQALDLADLDGVSDSAISAAAGIEGGLGSLIELAHDLATTDSLDTVSTLETEVNSAISGLKTKVSTIEGGVTSDDAKEMAAALATNIVTISAIANGASSIVNNKQGSLKALLQAKNALDQAQQNKDTGVEQLNKLFTQAKRVADDNQQAVSDQVSNGQFISMLVMIISLIFAFGISLTTVRSIIKPLKEVNSMLNIVASGDLTQHLNDEKDDEFGELAKNCNSLIGNLRELIRGIISRSTQLAAASEETSAITTQTTQAIQDQRSQMEQAATATTQMSSTSQSVMHSADEALTEVKQADSESQRIKKIAQENKATIVKLADEVEDASRVINKLHSDSASIGRILDVIRGIADQTNLLALNAAIEAARAGEQGRGFAVVADEVRSLASKTQESTQEIQSMIQVLQSGAEQAVEVMERGKQQADNCVRQTAVADQALESITNSVHRTHDSSEQISHAAQEQHLVSQQISERLESIVLIAEQTASGADQTAISSHEVARLSEELRLSVDQFKV
ncbi:MAG: methyl-accepting chemotaxis protein [Alteromonadaceae bacterium]|jgi:methyl-accepting chemotaxis protein